MYNKKTFLIDSENIGAAWKKLLTCKEKRDRIIVFYTDNTPNLSYTDLLDILQYPEEFESIKCYTGRDALDFQLVSYLGYLLKSSSKTDYYIVSKDTGYDAVCKFWCDMDSGISLQRIDSEHFPYADEVKKSIHAEDDHEMISAKDRSEMNTVSEPIQDIIQIIKEALPEEISDEMDSPNQIMVILRNTSKSNLQQLYLKLLKSFGQETGGSIYRNLKPHLTKIYDTLE